MPSNPKLAAALIKWAASNQPQYDAVVWALVNEALQCLRLGNSVAGERQALFLRFDAVLRGPPDARERKVDG